MTLRFPDPSVDTEPFFQWLGPRSDSNEYAAHQDRPCRREDIARVLDNPTGTTFIVEAGGKPVGAVWAFPSGPLNTRNVELSAVIGEPGLRRSPLAGEALLMAIDFLFMRKNLHKISARIIERNSPMLAILDSHQLGRREGTLRAYSLSGGALAEGICWGILRTEYVAHPRFADIQRILGRSVMPDRQVSASWIASATHLLEARRG
ncbi:GNAT family protein [Microbacterium sp. SL62]|uniref:GNAT family N-acetyltransferase n=1 Tax=Microbacterium sp. SL62 TaxID=2995139 RepID=UPI002272C0C4|nr:GNAT family protein [Microbacterium sp. SL62]MCY1716444.1 GNAT family protein [Microbacterium sp. SL62]